MKVLRVCQLSGTISLYLVLCVVSYFQLPTFFFLTFTIRIISTNIQDLQHNLKQSCVLWKNHRILIRFRTWTFFFVFRKEVKHVLDCFRLLVKNIAQPPGFEPGNLSGQIRMIYKIRTYLQPLPYHLQFFSVLFTKQSAVVGHLTTVTTKIWESTCLSSLVVISFLISTLASFRIMPRHHFNLNWVRRCIFVSVAPTKNLRA